jgi:uncharacterized protein YndB with AHSA1/START domain
MTIAPIRKSVTVRVPPARAFDLFTRQMHAWSPTATHTIAASPAVEIVVEPRVGGRWFERSADRVETEWGKVLAWEPPNRVLLAWQINAAFKYDPDLITELEISFAAEGAGTRVDVEHRDLERLGVDDPRVSEMLRNGWPGIIDRFAAYADS